MSQLSVLDQATQPVNIVLDISGPNTLPDEIFEQQCGKRQGRVFSSSAALAQFNQDDEEQSHALNDIKLKDIDSMNQDERMRGMTNNEYAALLHAINSYFIEPFRHKSTADIIQYGYEIFELNEKKTKGIMRQIDIQRGYEKCLIQVYTVYYAFLRGKIIGVKDAIQQQNLQTINCALKSIYYLHQIITAEFIIHQNVWGADSVDNDGLVQITRFSPADPARNKPFHNLILFLLEAISIKGYRIHQEGVYRQIFYGNYATHAWEYVMTTMNFILNTVDQATHNEMWVYMLDIRDGASVAAKHLNSVINAQEEAKNHMHNQALRPLIADRHLFSFQDGIYDAKALKFYKFGEHSLPSDRVAIKFFGQKFEPDALFNHQDYYNIPTPGLQHILDYQQIPEEVCRVVYAMIGRCLYDVNEIDSWEVILFVKGVAGSGKSTIGKLLMNIYPITDVRVLSSNIEKKFGLSDMHSKKLFVCFEVKANWSLDQGDFQCMVSGEDMSLPVKHMQPVSVTWKVPGMLMGNEVARSWLDAAGSMTRRVMTLEFNHRVKTTDTSLGRRMKNEMAALIHKSNMAYRHMVKECGNTSIWNNLPQYFHHTQQRLATLINPLEDFLQNCDQVTVNVQDLDCCMPLEDLQAKFLEFAGKNGYGRPRFVEDFYKTTFENYGLTVKVVDQKMWHNRLKVGSRWVYGVTLRDVDDALENIFVG